MNDDSCLKTRMLEDCLMTRVHCLHLFLKRLFFNAQLGLDICPDMKPLQSPHIPEHRPFRLQTKFPRAISHTLPQVLPHPIPSQPPPQANTQPSPLCKRPHPTPHPAETLHTSTSPPPHAPPSSPRRPCPSPTRQHTPDTGFKNLSLHVI